MPVTVQDRDDTFLEEAGKTVQGHGPGVSCEKCQRNSVICGLMGRAAWSLTWKGPSGGGSMVAVGTRAEVTGVVMALYGDDEIESCKRFSGDCEANDARAMLRRLAKNRTNRGGILVDHRVKVVAGHSVGAA